jgi:hypothetical protein
VRSRLAPDAFSRRISRSSTPALITSVLIDWYEVKRRPFAAPASIRSHGAWQIVVDTCFLRWDKGIPLRATQRLFERTLTNMEGSHRSRALEALAQALGDPELFPDIGNRNRLNLKKDQTFCGLRFTRSGEEFIGVRLQELPSILKGTGSREGLVKMLENAGVLAKGHGGKQTQQLNITVVKANGQRLTKPRLLVLQANKVEAFLDDALQTS